MVARKTLQDSAPEVLEAPRAARGVPFAPGPDPRRGNGFAALPDWFRSSAADALETIAKVATGELEDPRVSRAQAAVWMAERGYGKARPQPEEVEAADSPVMRLLLEVIARKGRP